MSKTSLNKLITNLHQDYPDLIIEQDELFRFSPPNSVFYAPVENAELLLLHEVGHYLLGRNDYNLDIELINIESSAWVKAKELCSHYKIKWDEELVQDKLDTYRGYLHEQSTCKDCGINGYQDQTGKYTCPLCNRKW
jgi:hypothetical protein